MTLRNHCTSIQRILLREEHCPAERTVAEHLCRTLTPSARILVGADAPGDHRGTFRIFLRPASATAQQENLTVRVEQTGNVVMSASHPALLYAGVTLLEEEWGDRTLDEFRAGVIVHPSFRWLRNLSDFLVGSLRHARGFDREDYLRQLARSGFTHVTVNGLGTQRAFESGPPGDRYSWFYDYSPDLDQFVQSNLLHGYYPPDYLQANLLFLKETVRLALKYGLTPGLHINSPRSMPEEFWVTHGYLRGARVDHPRESFRPRYTLAMAHPVVQEHYRQLVGEIMNEVPEIGFIHLWTNDSGSGFEFVSTLYAGRNGGPYLIREWKSEEEIAKAAARNVLTYYRLLRDESAAANPDFRLVCDLGPFMAERKHIVPELGGGIDAGEFAYFETNAAPGEVDALRRAGAETHVKIDVTDNNVLGVPFPFLVHERLTGLAGTGCRYVLAGATPLSLAPYDINAEVVRGVQLSPGTPLQQILTDAAIRWVDRSHADTLVDIWTLSDRAVRSFPAGVPMSTFGFPWFRLWVRPFVPDIDAIPEEERRYYEDFLLATFNNPARVDLNNDMMWNFLTVDQAGQKKTTIDSSVLPALDDALAMIARALTEDRPQERTREVLSDLRDRLRASRCFSATMRNSLAWTESVHGYLNADTSTERLAFHDLCRSMVDSETANARDLLLLWKESSVIFMPVSPQGETLHIYGENFGALLERKISIMERHRNDEPRVDPDYMWRTP